jgi:hypothetical protein
MLAGTPSSLRPRSDIALGISIDASERGRGKRERKKKRRGKEMKQGRVSVFIRGGSNRKRTDI